MASSVPSTSERITSTPECVGLEPLLPSSFQGSTHSPYLGLYDATNALNLSLPPNALRILAQGQASGRLPVPLNNHDGQLSGTAESVAAGKSTTTESHPRPTILRSSPETTSDQPPRVKVRAHRAPRAGKPKARDIVSRRPARITSSGNRSQSASPSKQPKAELSFPWATATAAEISRLPGLGNLPVDLIGLVLPTLRRFVEEHEGSIRSSSCAVGHGQDLPAETNELLRVAQPAGPFTQMAQAEPSLLMGQSDPTFHVAEQSCWVDQPPASRPAYGGSDALLQQRNENAEPEPIVEDPPSAALEGLLDLDHIWGGEVSQPESSLTLPTGEVIERSLWPGSQDLDSSSSVGYGVELSGVGTEVFSQGDPGALFDGWEGFAEL